jgi:pimeloyl-ACP methyl ester carboxylesterase
LTRRIALGDIEIGCEVLGPASGPVLVMLHGFTGHRDDFRELHAELAELGRTLIPDLRGHGDARPQQLPGKWGFSRLVSDLRALLDAEGLERCDLLGHSMGGMIALRFALEHPERVASLVLMNTSPEAPRGLDRASFERAVEIAQQYGMAELQRRMERGARERPATQGAERHIARWADQYWIHHRRRYAAMDPQAYASIGRAMFEQSPVVARLAEIRCPTLVMVGEDDSAFLPGAETLAAGIPDAIQVTIPQAGHHPHRENRGAWLEALAMHLERAR